MNEATTPQSPPAGKTASLYLRIDGTLMIVRDGQAVEFPLTPRQLLELGIDALQLAQTGEPLLLAEVTEVLSRTRLPIAVEELHATH